MLGASLVLVVMVAAPPPTAGVTIVVHPDSRITSISRAELSKVFLGRLRSWSDGTTALPVDQLPDRSVRARFSRRVHRRSVVTVEVYWKRMIFSGRGVPPDELANDQEVVAFVRAHPGAVGYVDTTTELAGMRELSLEN